MTERQKTWFVRALLTWSERYGRDFAWRHTTDPFQVLMAEMMVHRTRAGQAEAVWIEFVRRYPTAAAAAEATDGELRQVLAPVGLNWRIDNMLRAIRILAPTGTEHELSFDGLSGVGPYVSGAVAVFARGEDRAVVDANVVRVVGRFFGVEIHDGVRKSTAFAALASALVPDGLARRYTWALLDLGALVCVPGRPRCGECPLERRCVLAQRSLAGRRRE